LVPPGRHVVAESGLSKSPPKGFDETAAAAFTYLIGESLDAKPVM